MNTLERMAWIVDLIGGSTFEHVNEYDLQAGIHATLEAHGLTVSREITLANAGNRIDMFVYDAPGQPGIGIEVKINSSHRDVLRQLTRYAAEPDIAGLILVTTRSKHHHLPLELNGTPLRLATLIG